MASISMVETIPMDMKELCHPISSTIRAISGVAKAGPKPQEAIINPIANPRFLRNQIMAAGIKGTRNIACATPRITP